MAYRPLSNCSVSSPLARPRRPLKRDPPSRRRKISDSSTSSRPVLVPLHPNLRRLPSRIYLVEKDSEMPDIILTEQVGSKRKRVPSANENAHAGGRPSRGSGRLKRQRLASSTSRLDYTSDDQESSTMDIDSRISSAANSDSEQDESSDDFLITTAEPTQLLRLRKDELLRLYTLAGLSDDTDTLTKSEIVDSIVAARDELASLPPSSPLRGDGNSSEYSSDDGAGQVSSPYFSLRRRATTNDILKSKRPAKGRSLSMGQVLEHSSKTTAKQPCAESNGSSGPRRRSTNRSSPSGSTSITSPPAHHLRSRKFSAPTLPDSSDTPPAMPAHRSSKGKGRQVEFLAKATTPVTRSKRPNGTTVEDESDLTELDESEIELAAPQLSPRRLRSKDKAKAISEADSSQESRRVTPMRKAKRSAQRHEEDEEDMADVEEDIEESNGESDSDEEEEDEDVGSHEADEEEEEEEVTENREEAEEQEVDELVSTASATPPPIERTPVKRRLRPRPERVDEGSDGAEEEADDEEEEGEDGRDEEVDDDEMTIAVEPRKLRNGKIVGEEDVAMEEYVSGEDEEVSTEDEPVSVEEAEESDEEGMEEDVDLAIATAKTLIRLKRDDLVRLCETRDLEAVGTKPQLAEALLDWRDRQANDSSPSSAGTVRPPSTVIKRRRGGRKSSQETPILERSHHVHIDEPLTPPLSQKKENEPELELDLGTLGLEDREIPPDKLQKLEKIGSGGFKDVYVGKFRGKKIAISEFRGQLNSMDIKELKLLGGFNHPNIVRFLGVSIPENPRDTPVMIISELCANGDLFDYVRNVHAPSLHKVLSMMLDIAKGLEYLHLRKPSVIHRDCKSSNILITSKGVAKIADFGLAKVKQSTRSMVRSLVGTVNWQAPELWHAHPKYNHKVDVFSCGMVYWEMLQWHLPNKKFPWEGMNEHAIYEIVGTKKQRPSISGLRKQWCHEVVDLVERMWAQEHQDRPTMTEVVDALKAILLDHR